MQQIDNAQRLRIYTGESDKFEGRPLHEAIVALARKQGLAGATVMRGVLGFGANSRVHTSKILRLSEDMPMVTEIVDNKDRIEVLIPELDNMIGEGLIVREEVQVLVYRHGNGAKTKGE